MSNLIKSTGKKNDLIEETINLLNTHRQKNFDLQKSSSRLVVIKRKYNVDLKKIKIGDLL